jgi:hypothetical protein
MVDALRRAHRMIAPHGMVVDVHPTAAAVPVGVNGRTIGHVAIDGGIERHAAADAAIPAVVYDRLFALERVVEFDFFTYGDTIDELRDYIVENWRDARIDDDVVQRTRLALAEAPAGVRPRVLERVRLTILRPRRPAT